MTINKDVRGESIRTILREVLDSKEWDIDIENHFISKINDATETTSTDIEELRKKYDEKFPAKVAKSQIYRLSQIQKADIWDFFLPHLSNKPINTDIEELKKEFEERVIGETFAGGIFNDNDNQRMYTSGYADGFRSAKSISWRWFAPHLSNKSELKKEAVEEAFGNGFQYQDTKYIRYDTAQRYTEKAIKEAIMRFVKWYNDIPDYAIDAKIDMEEVNKYLSSNEKEESGVKRDNA